MKNYQRPFWFCFELNRFSQMSGQPEKLQYIIQKRNSAKSYVGNIRFYCYFGAASEKSASDEGCLIKSKLTNDRKLISRNK